MYQGQVRISVQSHGPGEEQGQDSIHCSYLLSVLLFCPHVPQAMEVFISAVVEYYLIGTSSFVSSVVLLALQSGGPPGSPFHFQSFQSRAHCPEHEQPDLGCRSPPQSPPGQQVWTQAGAGAPAQA